MNKKALILCISILVLTVLSVILITCIILFGKRSKESTAASNASEENTESYIDQITLESEAILREAAALEDSLQPAQSIVLKPQASGTLTAANEYATIDYSHTDDGYVMVLYTASTEQRLKSQVTGPTTTYTYDLTPGEWAVFPLSDGNGNYRISVFENIIDNRYAQVLAVDITVLLDDEFAPFIRPNQYVNYENTTATIETAETLTGSLTDLLSKVEAIYDYVVNNISYDTEKAAIVQSGYLPDLDEVLETGKGICFDYAALMTCMLRSQGIPCKLVVGYAGSAYHAWISVWSESTGWIDGAIYFNGTSWQRMDPTFAASGKSDPSVMEFIGDGTNYTSKYIY